MLPFKLVYGGGYCLPIGAHGFPAMKYRQIVECLRDEGIAEDADFVAPEPVTDDDVRLVHTPEYVTKLRSGTLNDVEQRQLQVPYSPELVDAFWLSGGGSVKAATLALRDGIDFNIGGGFHHAFANLGEGFWMINDVAIAIRRLKHDGKISRAMTVNCDVRQGNGTAAICNATQTQAEQHPYVSSGPVPEGSTSHIKMIPAPDFGEVFTISLHHDRLGGLGLSIKGLKKRDEMVFREARKRNMPVFVTLVGGYAEYGDDTVTIHCNTIVVAAEVYVTVTAWQSSTRS